MYFMGHKLGYWEGNVYFGPVGHAIEIFVDGSATEDMREQHAFFTLLRDRWSQLMPAIKTAIEAVGVSIPAASLPVSGVSIPKAALFDDANWDVSIRVPSGGSYTVEMKGATVQMVWWDC